MKHVVRGGEAPHAPHSGLPSCLRGIAVPRLTDQFSGLRVAQPMFKGKFFLQTVSIGPRKTSMKEI